MQNVVSPTFTIVQVYDCVYSGLENVDEIFHLDCYRLKSEEEFYNLGVDERFSDIITIIEWPEIIENFLPKNVIKVYFSIKDDVRRICF